MLLKIYQIYYDESQLSQIEYIPYSNKDKCTVFFENEVIRELIEKGNHIDGEYFGVVSYKLREKIDFLKRLDREDPYIANFSAKQFTPAEFESELKKNNRM